MTATPSKTHVFFFHGEDSYTRAKKIAVWKEKFEQKYGSQTITRIDVEAWQSSEDELLGACKKSIASQSLFSSDSLAIIENIFSSKTHQERVGAFFCENIPKMSAKSFLVFVERKVDKRLLLYKTFCDLEKKGLITMEEFLIPKGTVLSRWIQTELQKYHATLTPEALVLLLKTVDPPRAYFSKKSDSGSFDLWTLSGELHKLAFYAYQRAITRQDVQLLFPQNSQSHVFDCIAAFIKKDIPGTLHSATSIISEKGAPDTSAVLGLCSFFQNQLHDMLIIKDMGERKCTELNIANHLDWKKERVHIVMQQLKNTSLDFLKIAARVFIELERTLKSRPLDPQSILLYTVAHLLK